jgi:diguanylate cyclase (GGDEF)-like protein
MTQGEELDAAIAALWLRQRDEMLRRVDIVEAAVASLLEGNLEAEPREEAERAAHKIAGAAGSFGFADASTHAREIETAMRRDVTLADAPRLSELVVAIRREFERDANVVRTPSSESYDISDFKPDVLLICGDPAASDQLRAELTGRGLQVVVARHERSAALQLVPRVAVVDLDHALADGYMERAREVAVIGMTRDTSLDARVMFTRRGGRLLLDSSFAPAEVADAAAGLSERLKGERARILAVDDDPGLLELTATILRAHDYDVRTLDDPERFWQVLESLNPDVLLLDLEMPGFTGIELCEAVRADPRWSQLPVLFLTGRTEPEAIRAVFAAGADDYMTKPVVEPELIQRIANRMERVRLLRELADRDPLTGVANRRKASDELERLERLAKRYGQPLTVAILDLDNFKQINDSYGHDTGDEVLRRLARRLQTEFRGEDVVGRWGGEEFVVGMYGMPGSTAVERWRGLLDDWKRERFDDPYGGQFASSFTAGIAELPGAADSAAAALSAADEALYRGKAAGRSRVSVAGERGDLDIDQVDIAVVEDDSALVELLTHSLSTQGWSVRVLDDGPTAVGALASEPPLLRARLVLLDWDLPGLDGLAVLRRLRERGVLAQTKVVMLTARDSESEVLKALELGATDHVAKPFSVPVLLQKVRQVVGTR